MNIDINMLYAIGYIVLFVISAIGGKKLSDKKYSKVLRDVQSDLDTTRDGLKLTQDKLNKVNDLIATIRKGIADGQLSVEEQTEILKKVEELLAA